MIKSNNLALDLIIYILPTGPFGLADTLRQRRSLYRSKSASLSQVVATVESIEAPFTTPRFTAVDIGVADIVVLPDPNDEDVNIGTPSADRERGRLDDREDRDREDEDIFDMEDIILSVLSPVKMLIVFDHFNDLQSSDASTVLSIFLSRLLENCKNLKVLITSTDALGLRRINGLGVVENPITLGPLTLRSSLRLFARLSPLLHTADSKLAFVTNLIPPHQNPNVTVQSRELTLAGSKIFLQFGNGHPAQIVKFACGGEYNIEELVASCKSMFGEVIEPTSQNTPSFP